MLNHPVEDQDKGAGYLYSTLMLQVCALECFLNDMLIDLAYKHYGKESKAIAESYMGGNMKNKITRILPLLSNGTKRLDTGHHIVALIYDLLGDRNKLVHRVDHYNFDPDKTLDCFEPSAEQCRKYLNAVNEFCQVVHNGRIDPKAWDHKMIKDAIPGN